MGSVATGGQLGAVILAAGEGTRMQSQIPKPLHDLCGRAMVLHILDALAPLDVDRVVIVVGYQAERVCAAIEAGAPAGLELRFVHQAEQRGTGDAVRLALDAFDHFQESDDILVIPADTPLLTTATLVALVRSHRRIDKAVTLLSATVVNPTGYGRILRASDGRIRGIVEQADASREEQDIREINTSIYCFRAPLLGPALRRISAGNAQGELYLTDVVGVLFDAGYQTDSLVAEEHEVAGVNDRTQLAFAQSVMRRRIVSAWLARGIAMQDPERTTIDAGVHLHADTQLLAGTMLHGSTVVGSRCVIGPNAVVMDAIIGDDVVIESARIERATIHNAARVGSYSVVGPGAVIAAGEVVAPLRSLP